MYCLVITEFKVDFASARDIIAIFILFTVTVNIIWNEVSKL